MKKLIIVAITVIAIALWLSRDETDAPAITQAQLNTQWQVADYFKSKEEPRVKGAKWTSKNIFVVGVIDDGSRRDGYAEYVCLILDDFSLAQRTTVYVIDHNNMAYADNTTVLGKAYCK